MFFVLAAASIYLGYTNCAILLIFLGIISLLSKYWGKMALKDVDIKIEGSHQRIFKGETIPVKYIISNKKSLPLIWIELMHDIPQMCIRDSNKAVYLLNGNYNNSCIYCP